MSHIIILVIVLILSHIISKSSLSQYDIQITGGIFIIYFLLKKTTVRKNFQLFDGVIATLIISNLVESTGGLASPFFFLYFFLIFTLSLLLEPIISITTTLTIVFLYILTAPQNLTLQDFLPLLSLPFLTPFALVLGEEYEQIIKKNNQIKDSNFFLSLVIKTHIHHLKKMVDSFMGDHELREIEKTVNKMEKSIEDYEKTM